MKDQLHRFASEEEADTAFPRPVDDEGNPIQTPCWMAGSATVLPLKVELRQGDTVVAAEGYWMGVTCPDEDADHFWSMPSAQVEMTCPSEPVNWLACVTRSRLNPTVGPAVVGVTPILGGRPYLFAERPAEPEPQLPEIPE